FAAFEFDLVRSELKRADGTPITLRPKAEQLLRHFISDPGRLFSREELMDVLWPAAVVTDDSLVQCVGELRSALDDRSQALIRTVPRRGYRLDATVSPVAPALPPPVLPEGAADAQPSPADSLPSSSSQRPAGVVLMSVAAIAVAAGALVWAVKPGVARPMSLDETITARHVFAVMPLSVSADDPSLRNVAAQVGDEIAAQMATRAGSRVLSRMKTAAFNAPSPAFERLAGELQATYAITGRVRPAATGTTLDVLVFTVPEGAALGTASFDVETNAAAPTVAELGQLVANFVRGKVGELEYRRATAPGHRADAADLTIIGWVELERISRPDDVVRARSRFREALRQDPASLLAMLGLSASFVTGKSMGLPVTAEEASEFEHTLDRMLRTAPNDATAAMLWADLKLQEGRADLAIPSIEKAVRVTPQYANAHLMLAVALIRVGRQEEAGPALDRAIRLATMSNDLRRASTAYAAAAEIALTRGDDLRAAELARQAIAIRPLGVRSATPYAILAAAEALSGRVAEANADMAIYRQRSPGTTVATFDSTRPSRHPAFVEQRARLYQGLRLAGLPER
ncbi:MAG: winged helix-turn-helix domain-containing protein, partial [Caldimonas sp.]